MQETMIMNMAICIYWHILPLLPVGGIIANHAKKTQKIPGKSIRDN